jgi:hypothetical protein
MSKAQKIAPTDGLFFLLNQILWLPVYFLELSLSQEEPDVIVLIPDSDTNL